MPIDNRQFTTLSNIMKTTASNVGSANISQAVIQQVANGQIVTNSGDRQAIANSLELIGNSPAA